MKLFARSPFSAKTCGTVTGGTHGFRGSRARLMEMAVAHLPRVIVRVDVLAFFLGNSSNYTWIILALFSMSFQKPLFKRWWFWTDPDNTCLRPWMPKHGKVYALFTGPTWLHEPHELFPVESMDVSRQRYDLSCEVRRHGIQLPNSENFPWSKSSRWCFPTFHTRHKGRCGTKTRSTKVIGCRILTETTERLSGDKSRILSGLAADINALEAAMFAKTRLRPHFSWQSLISPVSVKPVDFLIFLFD